MTETHAPRTQRVVVRAALRRGIGDVVHAGRAFAFRAAAIGPTTRRGRRFGAMGDRSVICFPADTIFNERYIEIGAGTMIGPHATLSAGMAPGQEMMTPSVLRIGDRCVIGKGSSLVAHLSIDIGDDVWTGPHIYVTDQNHDYRDHTLPIGRQWMPEQPVSIGDGSWIGHGAVILPGATIGRHVVIGANSVVRGEIPDYSVAAGNPAKVVRTMDVDVAGGA